MFLLEDLIKKNVLQRFFKNLIKTLQKRFLLKDLIKKIISQMFFFDKCCESVLC
jgi:hypothetical protein